jgi:digeranylgeranylglycerophospholipid reductase
VRSETPDILVIGLGPAGSRAAAVAAASGFRVVAVERRSAPGRPVQCAEFVPALMEQEVAGLACVTQQAIKGMHTDVEGAGFDESSHFRGRMIDRAAFDALLAREAARAGALCRYGVAALAIAPDGSVLASDRRSLRPRVLIGADGPRSLVGRAAGRVNRDLVETRQVTVPLPAPQGATDIFLRADYRGGYGWLFPKGMKANLGLGLMAQEKRRLKPLLLSLHRQLLAEGRIGAAATGLTGGAIPVGGRLPAIGRIGRTPILLAGDAAGLTNPVTGAGIAAAVQSGVLAGEAAALWLAGRESALADYEDALEELFDGAMARALAQRRALLARYEGGGRPDAAALRAGWIAYPQYWESANGEGRG